MVARRMDSLKRTLKAGKEDTGRRIKHFTPDSRVRRYLNNLVLKRITFIYLVF